MLGIYSLSTVGNSWDFGGMDPTVRLYLCIICLVPNRKAYNYQHKNCVWLSVCRTCCLMQSHLMCRKTSHPYPSTFQASLCILNACYPLDLCQTYSHLWSSHISKMYYWLFYEVKWVLRTLGCVVIFLNLTY